MDVLSDTLRVVRLAGAVFFNATFGSPWAIFSAPSGELARFLRLPSNCLALFHVVAEGACWLALDGQEPLHLETGDIIIMPHGEAHVLGSTLSIVPEPLGPMLPTQLSDEIPLIRAGGSGQTTSFVCGFLSCDQRFNPLIGALPSLLHVRMGANDDERDKGERNTSAANTPTWAYRITVRSGDWLETTLRHTVEEAFGGQPGGSVMLARLTEILYVEVLRRYMRELPAEQGGWLAGVSDPVVGEALRLLHAQPERPWTVESLARAIAVSRSTLAQRFVDLIGEPPIRYLASWRIHLARQLLRQTSLTNVEIARRIGYESVAAFNRAFRRQAGQPPATWRANGVQHG